MKYELRFALLTSLVGVFALSACGKDDPVAREVDRQVTEATVNDTWKTNCQNVTLDIFGLSSEIVTIDLGASLSRTTTYYNENNCATATLQVVENGSYTLGQRIEGGHYPLDEQFQSVAITPLNDAGRDSLNLVNACGISNWVVNESRDVTSASSDNPVLARCWIKTPRNQYDLVHVESDQLRMGLVEDGRDKSTAEKRPTAINQEVVYTRQ